MQRGRYLEVALEDLQRGESSESADAGSAEPRTTYSSGLSPSPVVCVFFTYTRALLASEQKSGNQATNVPYHNSKTRFTDHGVSIPLRMPTGSNVCIFVFGGFAFFHYYTIVYVIIFVLALCSVVVSTDSLEPSDRLVDCLLAWNVACVRCKRGVEPCGFIIINEVIITLEFA